MNEATRPIGDIEHCLLASAGYIAGSSILDKDGILKLIRETRERLVSDDTPNPIKMAAIMATENCSMDDCCQAAKCIRGLHAENTELLNENIVLKNGYKKAAAERDALRAALEQLKSDCQCTIDLHDRVGPTWTVKGHGMYDESFVLAKMAELIGVVDAALPEPAKAGA